jgi:hypothetical protein
VAIFTHRIDGHTENDFIRAAKVIDSSPVGDTLGLNELAAGKKLGTIRNRSRRKESLWRNKTPSKPSGFAR